MLKFNLIFLMIVGFLLSSCTLKGRDTQSKQINQASFSLKDFKGVSGSAVFNEDFKIPKAKQYHFTACLKDLAYNRELSYREFNIQEISTKIKTDSQGCLQWDETIEYNYLLQSHYVEIKRTIEMIGNKNDQLLIRFAINPWLHGEKLDEVIDLKNSTAPALMVPKDSEIAHLTGTDQKNLPTAQLWIEDGRLFTFENNNDGNGLTLDIDARTSPLLKLKKMNGDTVLVNLNKGQFTAELSLIHQVYIQKSTQRRIIGKALIDRTEIENNVLRIKSLLNVCAPPSNGQLYLGIKLRPINGPSGITDFEGIFFMGEFDAIKSNLLLKNSNFENKDKKVFKIADYTEDMTANAKLCQRLKLEENYQEASVAVSPLDFKFLAIGHETTTTKEIIYRISACVKNSVDGKLLRGQTFHVKKFHTNDKEQVEELELKTDENSCLVWNERITFLDNACQHNIKGQVSISSTNRGLKKNIPMVINPWEFWGMMAQDLRYVPDTESLVLDCNGNKKGDSLINITSYTLNTLEHHTHVDSDLKLRITKKYRISMSPDILRYSNLSAGRKEEAHLRAGLYLLKIAVVPTPGYEKAEKIIAHANKIAYATGGNLRTDFELSTTDIKSIGNRNQLLIEVYPIKESLVEKMKDNTYQLKDPKMSFDDLIAWDAGLVTPTFTAPIMLDSDNSGANVDFVDQDLIANYFINQSSARTQTSKINEIVERFRKKEKTEAPTFQQQTEFFAHENNLELIQLTQAQSSLPLRTYFGFTDKSTPWMISSVDRRVEEAKPIGYQPLQKMVLNGKLNEQEMRNYCFYWFNYLLKNSIEDGMHKLLLNSCLASPEKFFITEKRLLIKNIVASEKIGGYQHNINFGTTFSLSDTYSESLTRSLSVAGNIGIGLPDSLTGKLVKVNVNGGYSVSSAESNSTSQGNTVNVGAQTNLQVRVAEMKWQSDRYEQCLIVRLNPRIFETNNTQFWAFRDPNFTFAIREDLTKEQKFLAMTKGSMICLGRDNTDKITRFDKYFRIDQVIESAEFQDRGDVANRRLFMIIRGEHEYQKVLSLFRHVQILPDNALPYELTELKQIHQMESILTKPLQNILSFHLEAEK